MAYSTIKFLGASVKSVSSSIGWGAGQPSQCRVQLVEDIRDGDSFAPPTVGKPVTLQVGNFFFNGLLQQHGKSRSQEGFPAYEATVTDPREILEGAQLILDRYNGQVPIGVNILNVFAYWENNGFGASFVNESGMAWRKIRDGVLAIVNSPVPTTVNHDAYGKSYTIALTDAVSSLDPVIKISDAAVLANGISLPFELKIDSEYVRVEQNLTNDTYRVTRGLRGTTPGFHLQGASCSYVFGACGGPLLFQGVQYGLDLSQLPTTPDYYRLGGGGGAVSLLEAISTVCEDGGCDFFVELSGFTIRVRTVSRFNQPPLGTISNIAETNWGGRVIRSQSGLELRNETTTSFLVGGDIHLLHLTNQIASFWGYDLAGNPILGRPGIVEFATGNTTPIQSDVGIAVADTILFLYDNAAHDPSPPIETPTPPFYFRIDNEIIKVTSRLGQGGVRTGRYQVERGAFGTTPASHLFTAVGRSFFDIMATDVFDLNASPVSDFTGSVTYSCSALELRVAKTNYESWAMYMRAVKPDLSGIVGISAQFAAPAGGVIGQPIRADFINEEAFNAFIAAGNAVRGDEWARSMRLYQFVKGYADEYLGRKYAVSVPFLLRKTDPETLRTSNSYDVADGGYLPEGASPLGISALNADILKLPDGRFKAFILHSNTDNADLSYVSPQGSVTENGALYSDCQASQQIIFTPTPAVVIGVPPVYEVAVDAVGDWNVVRALLQLPEGEAEQLLETGFLGLKVAPAVLAPSFAAVPLRSNVATYGPWYATGAAGKARVESDPSMVPWNFGGFAQMNLVATTRVANAVTNMQVSESGLVEETELPRVSLGDTLQSGGPNVTNIEISFGAQGVSTSYHFRTYTQRYGVFGKAYEQKLRKISAVSAEIRKAGRTALRQGIETAETIGGAANAARAIRGFLEDAPAVLRRQSPPDTMVSCGFVVPSGVRQNIQTALYEEAISLSQAHDPSGYRNVALMSMDGLFRPFSTGSGVNDVMPVYGVPPTLASPSIPCRDTLDPWKAPNDIEVLANGEEYGGLHIRRRGGSLDNARPFALRGPLMLAGWGFSTEGLPVPASGAGFHPDHLTNQSLWKVGPVDHLWDDARKVWTSHDLVFGTASGDIAPASWGVVQVPTSSGFRYLDAYNQGSSVASGELLQAGYFANDNYWRLLGGSGGGSGTSLTVQDIGGLPPVTDVATLIFDTDSVVTVDVNGITADATVTIGVNVADETQAGVVSVGQQNFLGPKIFIDSILYLGDYGAGLDFGGVGYSSDGSTEGTMGFGMQVGGDAVAFAALEWANAGTDNVYFDVSGRGTPGEVVGFSVNSVNLGITGTGGAGDSFYGGICTGLGGGGSVDVANGGTGNDLSFAGPGVLVQAFTGAAMDVIPVLTLDLGGTDSDLSLTGPGVVIQANIGDPLTVASQSVNAFTNNITSGGTSDQADNWTNLTTYSSSAAAIRNAVYQCARKIKQIDDALIALGIFT